MESVSTCALPGSEAKEFPLMFYLSDTMDIGVVTFNAVRGRDVISSDVMIMGKTDHGQLPQSGKSPYLRTSKRHMSDRLFQHV